MIDITIYSSNGTRCTFSADTFAEIEKAMPYLRMNFEPLSPDDANIEASCRFLAEHIDQYGVNIP